MVALVSRLVAAKGLDLIVRMMDEILQHEDIQFVMLGTGDREYEEWFKGLEWRFPNKVSANIKFSNELAQRMYAAADIFLMPSQSEPCGLSQMIASRYATIPVVRETGGLYDTIKPYNKFDGSGNGFTFANYNAHEMKDAVLRAVELYRDEKSWTEFAKHAMKTDFSWNVSAEKYLKLYEDTAQQTR